MMDEDKIRKKIELIRQKVRHIFDLLDEIEKELGYGRMERRANHTSKSDYHSNIVNTSGYGEEKEEERMGAEDSTSSYHS